MMPTFLSEDLSDEFLFRRSSVDEDRIPGNIDLSVAGFRLDQED
jgi:hypothetical protein